MLIILLLGAAFGGGATSRLGIVQQDRGPLARRFVRRCGLVRRRRSSRTPGRGISATPSRSARSTPASSFRRTMTPGSPRGNRHGPVRRPPELGRPAAPRDGPVGGRKRGHDACGRPGALTSAWGAVRSVARARDCRRRRDPARRRAAHGAERLASHSTAQGRFDQSASILVLFVFLNSLNGAVWLIETRRLGIARRMMSTPTGMRNCRRRAPRSPHSGGAHPGRDHRPWLRVVLRGQLGDPVAASL